MNYYTAKFKRESKPKPSDWLVLPNRSGNYSLVFIGASK